MFTQHLLKTNSRLAIVTKFLCHMVLKRRRNRAVKVMVGALSAFTNSNAIGRYARRVHWGSRRLQAVVRGRIACMSSHLALLNRQWDRLHPPIPVPQTIAASAMSSPPLSTALPVSLPDIVEGKVTGEAMSPNGSKRPARRKGAGGQGGQKKGKGRKSQQSVVAVGKAGASGRGGGGGRGQAAAVRKAVSTPDNDSSAPTEAKRRGRPPPHVSSKAKHDEIISWLQRTRSKHCKDVINYERFTVRTHRMLADFVSPANDDSAMLPASCAGWGGGRDGQRRRYIPVLKALLVWDVSCVKKMRSLQSGLFRRRRYPAGIARLLSRRFWAVVSSARDKKPRQRFTLSHCCAALLADQTTSADASRPYFSVVRISNQQKQAYLFLQCVE